MEVGAAIAAFCLPTQTSGMLIRTMNESMQLYEENEYIREGVDFMQSGVNQTTFHSNIITNKHFNKFIKSSNAAE